MKALNELITILEASSEAPNKKERLLANKKAIDLLKKLEEESREPTNAEKITLKGFTGYGGLGGIDNDEYYTPKEVASVSWDLLDVQEGDKILDPSTGSGVFSGTAPSGVSIQGCDYNPISGKIANILHDNSDIEGAMPFERYAEGISDNSMDGVITNVPFGKRESALIGVDMPKVGNNEDYFILKSLQLLKYGKRGVFLTTSSTAERKTSKRTDMRKKFLDYGSFLGGYRLPSEMFSKAGTNQVVDILVFEKHPEEVRIGHEKDIIQWSSWKEVLEKDKINKSFVDGTYFNKFPKHVLGEFSSKEEQVAKAEANGDKIHHMAQRDTVTLPKGVTLLQLKLTLKKYMAKLKNTLKYEDIIYIQDEPLDDNSITVNLDEIVEEAALKETTKRELDAEKYLLEDGLIGGLMSDTDFMELIDRADALNISISKKDRVLFTARYRSASIPAWSGFLNILFFNVSKLIPQVIKDNKDLIQTILKQKTKLIKPHTPYQSLIISQLNVLAKYNLETGELVEDINTLLGKEDSIFENKQGILEEGVLYYDISSFTKEELLGGSILLTSRGAVELEQWLVVSHGRSLRESVKEIKEQAIGDNSNLSEEEIKTHKQEMIDRLKKDYSSNIKAKDFS
ncbi:MAG TPA: hypothetical protein EYG70_08020, partial [Sulfurimonas sp.]|nr:hypothetical protein [Sulfurimonas sp.]